MGLGPSFPKLLECPKYPKALFDLNDKLKAWDYFLYIYIYIFLLMILGIRALFGPNFHKLPWCPKYPKTGWTDILKWVLHFSKASIDVTYGV